MATTQPQVLLEQGLEDSKYNETQHGLSKGHSYIS